MKSDKITKAIIETALETESELFNGDREVLALAAGSLGIVAGDALAEAVNDIIHQTLAAAKDSDDGKEFTENILERVKASEDFDKLHGIVQFLARFATEEAENATQNKVNKSRSIGGGFSRN